MFDIERIRKSLLKELHEGTLVSRIQKLKQVYTQDRSQIKKALEDPEMVSAYALFNITSHVKKFEFLCEQFPLEMAKDLSELFFVDWGMGPGTFSLAFAEIFQPNDRATGYVEQNPLMIEQANNLMNEFFPKKKLVQARPGQKNCLFFGNVINEIGNGEALKEVRKFDPEVIIIIEPGTPSVFPEILSLRDSLIQLNYNQVYPCKGHGPCPMDLESDWCHQIIRTKYDQGYERLCQKAKLNRRILPFCGAVFTKKDYGKERGAREVKFVRETKHSFEYLVCEECPDKKMKLREISLPKKSLSKKEVKSLAQSNLGKNFEYEVVKDLGEGKIRVQKISKP